jgi:hypothetical protein
METSGPSDNEIPEVIKAFIDSASPPAGQGNAYFKTDWKILLTFIFYLPYCATLYGGEIVYWLLFFYSLTLVAFFANAIASFKERMAFESNPFDFVKVELLFLFFAIMSFGCGYTALSKIDPLFFNQPLDWIDGLYFSVVTIATVGYGDLVPLGKLARLTTISEIFLGIWFFVTVVPVAVADQAERLRHFRAGREKMAISVRKAFDRGELRKPDQPRSD